MKLGNKPPALDANADIPALIESLLATEQRLEELTAGEVDTVAGRDGRMFLLRRAQEELRFSEAARQAVSLNELRVLFDMVPAMIWLKDTEGRSLRVNQRVADLAGKSIEEIEGKPASEHYPPEAAWHYEDDLEVIHSGVPKTGRVEKLRGPNGQELWVQTDKVPIRDQAGKVTGLVVMAQDISQRKRDEESLRASEANRAAAQRLASEELLGVNRKLMERGTEIKNFYHTLSHELKTPLTSAREFISILIDGLAGPLNETQLEYLGIAKESCDQLRLYINDMLDVTRLETGKMNIEFRAVSLAALVEHLVETLAPAAKGKNIRLSFDGQPSLPDVPLDRQRIMQVLTNLTSNAIKFTPAGGEICLSVSASPDSPECLQVAVRDTGRGIPEDQLGLIFNRLHQADHDDGTTESRSGLGLGLYICQELVQLHGGRIWAESELGRGSTFTFTIPMHQAPATLNVLVVDDDPEAIELVRAQLEPEHFHVTPASSGTKALEEMHRRLPDMVLLDLQMPGLDGAGTLEEIRKFWDAIPVIVITSYPESKLMMRALRLSPFSVLAKPCAAQRMVEAVRAAIASRAGGKPAT